MAIAKYALARVVVLLGVAGVLYLAGARSWLLWLGALLLAAMVSYVVLPGVRDDAAGSLARQDDRRTRVDDDADEEDAMLDDRAGDDVGADDDRAEDDDARGPDDVRPDDDPGPGDAAGPRDAAAEQARGETMSDGDGSTLERVPEAVEDAPTRSDSDEADRRSD
ncbi:DUF4229 domain-containing protein [Georgenia sp. Z1491]|uniref:DUF4229 domain-containing protein n=1 Tax=Georgenia sp. Z1491 TaxID=3416707 RepID=UPI003CE7BEC7